MKFKIALVLILQFWFLSESAIAEKKCAKNQMVHFIKMLKNGVEIKSDLSELAIEELEKIRDANLNYYKELFLCQVLGQEISELKEFWPSNKVKYTVSSHGNNEKLDHIVAEAYSRMSHRLDDLFGFSFSSSINVVFADNKNDMYKLAKPFMDVINIHYMDRHFFNQYKTWCDETIPSAGIVVGDLILICINPSINNISRIEAGLVEAVAHEFFHVAQIEITGFSVFLSPGTSLLQSAGPAWLLEGSAVVFAKNNIEVLPLLTLQQSLANQRKNTSYDFNGDYSVFEKYDYFGGHYDHFYSVSERMVNYLILQYGQENVFQFYTFIGNRADWKVAFHEAFGLSIDDFYKEINTFLTD